MAEYGAEKKVTKYSSVFASVTVGIPSGVTLKIKYISIIYIFIYKLETFLLVVFF